VAVTRQRPRRTQLDGRRSEARGTARERLLEAAGRAFARRGYDNASIDDIAADAGVTKGAVYWNFENKAELFFALLEERVDQGARGLMELTRGASSEAATSPAVSAGLSAIIDEQRELLLLLHEYWSLAVRDQDLGRRYAERQLALRQDLAEMLKVRHATTGVPLTVSAERLATVILAMANGLAMDRLVDPVAVPDDLFGEALDLIYDGLTYRATVASSQESPPGREAEDRS
jgi:AcrR family transcriptional regulator